MHKTDIRRQLLAIAAQLDEAGNHSAAAAIDVAYDELEADGAADLLMDEPIQKGRINTSELPDWEVNGGYNNIMQLLQQATPEEVDFWGHWYHSAHDNVKQLANKYKEPLDVVAGVVAVLSPGNTWLSNLAAADKILKEEHSGSGAANLDYAKVNAYNANRDKARNILITGNPDGFVRGPKVQVFYASLKDPSFLKDHLVLDGHAINIWRGQRQSLKQTPTPSVEEREQMLADYHRAAADTDLSVQAVQALTWFLWKSTKHS